MKLSRMILYSPNTKVLSSFISEMFDTELTPNNETIDHRSSIMNFQITPVKGEKGQCPSADGQVLEFSLEGEEDLESIKQKVQFFCYRHEISLDDLIVSQSKLGLVIKDPDGRHWKFSSKDV